MAHTYYEPTEYEQMLLAAGWVKPEDLDPDYWRYTKISPGEGLDGGVATYDQWQGMKREWDALNAEYEAIEADFPDQFHPHTHRQDQLLDQMSRLEYLLGY